MPSMKVVLSTEMFAWWSEDYQNCSALYCIPQ